MKKTIYMISTMFYPSIGGVENHIYYLSKNIINMGFNVKIIKPTLGIEKTNVYILDGIEVHEVKCGTTSDKIKYDSYKKKSKGSVKFFYGYKRKYFYNKFSNVLLEYIENDIKNNNISDLVIHQHDFISSIKLSKRLSKKYDVIFTNHTGEFLFIKKLIFSNTIIKYLTKHFKFIIAPSEELASFDGIRENDSYKYIPNGVDLNIFYKYESTFIKELKQKYNLNSNKITVLCPRRWAPTKGISYLVESINILKEKGYENKLQFVFVGNDYMDYSEYRSEILSYINDKSLDKMINLLGNVDSKDMSELINCADIVAIPSLMEAVSLSALEAMACGKIILSTNVGGFPQIINNNETGYMVEPKNSEALAEQIEFIIKTFEHENIVGSNAREFVVKNYSWENIAKQTAEVYCKNIKVNH